MLNIVHYLKVKNDKTVRELFQDRKKKAYKYSMRLWANCLAYDVRADTGAP